MTTRRTVIKSGLAAIAAAAVASPSASAKEIEPPITPKGDFTSLKDLLNHIGQLNQYISDLDATVENAEIADEIEKAATTLSALLVIANQRGLGPQITRDKLIDGEDKLGWANLSQHDDIAPEVTVYLWGKTNIPMPKPVRTFCNHIGTLRDHFLQHELGKEE